MREREPVPTNLKNTINFALRLWEGTINSALADVAAGLSTKQQELALINLITKRTQQLHSVITYLRQKHSIGVEETITNTDNSVLEFKEVIGQCEEQVRVTLQTLAGSVNKNGSKKSW